MEAVQNFWSKIENKSQTISPYRKKKKRIKKNEHTYWHLISHYSKCNAVGREDGWGELFQRPFDFRESQAVTNPSAKVRAKHQSCLKRLYLLDKHPYSTLFDPNLVSSEQILTETNKTLHSISESAIIVIPITVCLLSLSVSAFITCEGKIPCSKRYRSQEV